MLVIRLLSVLAVSLQPFTSAFKFAVSLQQLKPNLYADHDGLSGQLEGQVGNDHVHSYNVNASSINEFEQMAKRIAAQDLPVTTRSWGPLSGLFQIKIDDPVSESDSAGVNFWGISSAIIFAALLPATVVYIIYSQSCQPSQPNQGIEHGNGYSYIAIVALISYIVLLTTADIVANASAQAHGGTYPWNPVLAVALIEFSKMVVSGGLVVFERRDEQTSGQSARNTIVDAAPLASRKVIIAGVKAMSVSALLYAGNNCVNLFVLSKMRLDTFVIWRNMGILFNAIIWSQYFGRRLNVNKLLGVASMFIGCCMSDIQTNGTFGQLGWPVLLVLGTALISALGAVVTESVLKAEELRALSVNAMNLILYVETLIILAIALSIYKTIDRTQTLLHGFDASALAYIAVQTTLGLVVSRVLKYADSVAKVVAGGMREVITLLVAPIFVDSRNDWISITSGCWVLLAVVIYFKPVADPKEDALQNSTDNRIHETPKKLEGQLEAAHDEAGKKSDALTEQDGETSVSPTNLAASK